ncbi:MAG: hypothetical protein LBP95_14345 [Deltaproteobacteria bacterium]|nr:hypothetical protein [Deltaproteobacteria bacterium]
MNTNNPKLVGYSHLVRQYHLKALPNWHVSAVDQIGAPQTYARDGQVESTYPMSFWPCDGFGDQPEFALDHDGVNLGILSSLFKVVPTVELENWIGSMPTGECRRKVWFLHKFLTGRKLSLPDMALGDHVEPPDSDRHFSMRPGQLSEAENRQQSARRKRFPSDRPARQRARRHGKL